MLKSDQMYKWGLHDRINGDFMTPPQNRGFGILINITANFDDSLLGNDKNLKITIIIGGTGIGTG